MKIVVLDGYTLNPGDLSWDGFQDLGSFTCYDRTDPNDVIGRIGDSEAVITNKTPIDEAVLSACPSIKYVGVLATGYNVVDIDAATARNIVVTNIPTYGTTAVSQFVFALLLEICHNVKDHNDAVKAGRWETNPDFCFWDHPLMELHGKTLGIIGFGRIGRATARIAEGFGMNVLAFDEYPNKDFETERTRLASLDDVLEKADVISLHCPLFDSTEGMINSDSISRMKDGVIIINTSRGPLIVEDDLARALSRGKVKAAGVDVVSTEPIERENPLLGAPNCFITPHIAWAPLESRSRLMDIAVSNLKAYLGGNPQNRVN